MKLAAFTLVSFCILAGCADTEEGADSPLEAWEQAWDDTEEEVRTNMCGTFRGEVPLSSGENGPEALYDALDEEGYVISLDYDDWSAWMQDRCE